MKKSSVSEILFKYHEENQPNCTLQSGTDEKEFVMKTLVVNRKIVVSILTLFGFAFLVTLGSVVPASATDFEIGTQVRDFSPFYNR